MIPERDVPFTFTPDYIINDEQRFKSKGSYIIVESAPFNQQQKSINIGTYYIIKINKENL